MHEVWRKASAGANHMLVISGEAGVGKTRLAEELLTWAERQGYVTARAGCYEAEGRLAYGPVTEWLQSDAIYETLLTLPQVWQVDALRLLPRLRTDLPNLPRPEPLTESWQRQRLFAAITQAVLATPQPLILFMDDIQWCDADTLAWLHYLLHFHPSAPILILATIRAEALHSNETLLSLLLTLRRGGGVNELELQPLDRRHTGLLAARVAGRKLSREANEALYRRTEGNPLFIVEMVRAALVAADGPRDWQDENLPGRVQAVIEQRLARLSQATRRLLALCAVIGREFNFETLSHSCDEDTETILKSLEELWEQRIIREQGPMTYDFSHGVIRDVVRGDIVSIRRVLLHRRVAQTLEQVHAGHVEAVSGRLAHHWEEAGEPLRAAAYHLQAGLVAQHLYANRDAEHHLQQGRRLCRTHLSDEASYRQEMRLLQALSPSLVQGRGYASSQVQEAGARVQILSRRLHEPLSSPQLRMVAISELVRGRITQAGDVGAQLLARAAETEDAVAEVEAHYVLGVTAHWSGRFGDAKTHLEQAIALYRPQNHETHIRDYAQNPAVICRVRLALVMWHLGLPLSSQAMGQEALTLARELDHPFSRAYAMHWFAWLQNLQGRVGATLKHATASISFSEEYEFPYFATQSKVLLGWVLVQRGFADDGLHMMREGLSRFRGAGSEVGCAYYRALIAQTLAARGAVEQSLSLLTEAQHRGRDAGECWSDAAIGMIKGQVLEARDPAGAEASYRQALAIARGQDARMDALLTVRLLAGLLRRSQRGAEADALLREVRQWAITGLPTEEQSAVGAMFAS